MYSNASILQGVGFSITFSATNEVSIPQDTVIEPLSQAHGPTVQEKPSQVQLWLDHILRA